MQTVNIGSGVKTIGDVAFEEMQSLTTIAIPNNVIDVGENAFYNDQSLKTATIGKNVNYISWCDFINCLRLESFTVDSSNKYLKSIDGVLYVDEAGGSLSMVHLPAWTKQTTITIPAALTTIGYDALFTANGVDNPYLQGFVLEKGNITFSVDNGIWYNANKSKIIMLPKDIQIKNLKIPFTSGTPTIGSTFSNLINVQSITFASGFTGVVACAFEYSPSLTAVILPTSITSIGSNVFFGDDLGYIYIPSTVASIGTKAFTLNTVILGISNSYANTYATSNGKTFSAALPYTADVKTSLSAILEARLHLNIYILIRHHSRFNGMKIA